MLSFFTLKKQLNFVKNMNYNIQYSLLIVAFLFIQCAESSPTEPNNIPDLNPVLLEKTKIVFDSTSYLVGGHGTTIDDIYTISPDGSNQLNISNTAHYAERFPTWSSDGSRIIYVSAFVRSDFVGNDGGTLSNVGILSMNANGADRIQEFEKEYRANHPSWSPNDSHIAFTSNLAGHRNIYTINANGLKQLTNNYATDSFPSWSSDGSKIVFVSERDNNSEIYIMNSDGSNQINVTCHPDYDAFPSWSPDGSKIAFISNRDGSTQIYIMNADGTNQFKITNNSFFIRSLDWSPVIN